MDAEVDRLVLLVAHAEQAWTEAKRTSDDDVRRSAKGLRKRLAEARGVIEKWQGCAQEHGAVLDLWTIKRRIDREVPSRKAEIALPSPGEGLRPPSSSEGAVTAPSETSPR
jgi:hypothetical protein